MDIIISANSEIKKMIEEMPLDENNKVSPEKFQKIIVEIAKGTEKNEL